MFPFWIVGALPQHFPLWSTDFRFHPFRKRLSAFMRFPFLSSFFLVSYRPLPHFPPETDLLFPGLKVSYLSLESVFAFFSLLFLSPSVPSPPVPHLASFFYRDLAFSAGKDFPFKTPNVFLFFFLVFAVLFPLFSAAWAFFALPRDLGPP